MVNLRAFGKVLGGGWRLGRQSLPQQPDDALELQASRF